MKVDWTRDPVPTPPATFIISLDESEAEMLCGYLTTSDSVSYRVDHSSLYDIYEDVQSAIKASRS